MTLGVVDLSYLTDEERERILDVVRRDDQLRELEQNRIRSLKDEVKSLRLKGTIREGPNATRMCARCREALGLIFNTGSACPKCLHRVCKKCQVSVPSGNWICVFCFRQMEYEAKSGNWFYSKFPRSMRDCLTNEIVNGGKIVQDSISADELDYAGGLEPSQADAERPRLLDGNCGTAVSADFLAASRRTSSGLPRTSIPPTEESKVSWISDCEGSEVVMQEQSSGMPRSETAQDASLEFGSERGLDVIEVDSKAKERLGTSQTEDDAGGYMTAGNGDVMSSNPSSCQIEDNHDDDADRVGVAENLHARSSSELESLNFSLNSGDLLRDIADDASSNGACGSDKQSDESRRLFGVYDSNDSAFEDDVDCQAHLGSGYGEALDGSCAEVPVSFSHDLGTATGTSNDGTSGVIGMQVDKTDPLSSGVSCDAGTVSGEATTSVGSSLVDEAGYFPPPYCSGTEDVPTHFIDDSKDSEPYNGEPACTYLSSVDGTYGTYDGDVPELVSTDSVACLSHCVSDGLPSVDPESNILRPVENCEESEAKISEHNECGDLDDKPGCNLDGYDEQEPFLAAETRDGVVLEFADGKEELNCKNVFQVPDNSSFVSQNVILPEVLERELPAMDWNLEFSGVKEDALLKEKQSPISDCELHATPLVTPVVTSPEVVYVAPILDGVDLEKCESVGNGPVCVSANAGNGAASVRSKVGALLAKYSHHLESEKCPEDGDRTALGMSRDVSSTRSRGVGYDTVIESRPGFYPRLASSPVLGHEFVASDFDSSFGGLSTSARAVNIPDIAGLSDRILQTRDFDRQTDDVVAVAAGMNCDLSEEEFGSDSPWDSDNCAGRVPTEDDSDGDMEWDGIELCKAVQGAPHRDGSVEIPGDFDRPTNDLSALRSMLSSCLSDSGFRGTAGSPPRSLSPTEGCETPPEDPRNVALGRVPKRGYPGASATRSYRSGVKEDDALSVISEHTEPESDGDDS